MRVTLVVCLMHSLVRARATLRRSVKETIGKRGVTGSVSPKFAKRSGFAFATAGLATAALRRSARGLRPSSTMASETVSSKTHESYKLLKEEYVAEYGTTCFVYEHIATKAQVLSVSAPDDNKVFGVVFRKFFHK